MNQSLSGWHGVLQFFTSRWQEDVVSEDADELDVAGKPASPPRQRRFVTKIWSAKICREDLNLNRVLVYIYSYNMLNK